MKFAVYIGFDIWKFMRPPKLDNSVNFLFQCCIKTFNNAMRAAQSNCILSNKPILHIYGDVVRGCGGVWRMCVCDQFAIDFNMVREGGTVPQAQMTSFIFWNF